MKKAAQTGLWPAPVRGHEPESDPIEQIYQEIRRAFAQYGGRLSPRLRATRRKILARHLRDGFDLEELPSAVDGYVWQHRGLDTEFSAGTARDFFHFETVYKLDKFELRIELGAQGPWTELVKPTSKATARETRERQEREQYRRLVLAEREFRPG